MFAKRLDKLGIKTVRELLWHFPARYEDFSKIYNIAELEPGQQATISGVVEEIGTRRTWRRHMTIVEAIIADETGSIRAVWFNQPYIANTLRQGRMVNFAGKVSLSDEGEMYFSHPAYEIVKNGGVGYGETETRHTARLVPIYPETRGLTSKGIRFLVQPILKNLDDLPEWLPNNALKENGFPEINQALKDIHFPAQVEDALVAKKRFAFEDLFLLQLANLRQKSKLAEEKAPVIETDLELVKKILAELPFELTLSQKKSLWEILQDVERGRPMNRLLQGDVGSGKTVIAVLAALTAAESGLQTAFMAPTEILARQHFLTIKKLFSHIKATAQPTICLLTSSESRVLYPDDMETIVKKPELIKKIQLGEVKIVIGTHALIQKNVLFKDLALVIIDEQHRFGVSQRQALAGGTNAYVPHLLSMSATPIPRTLMLTVFGDLDVSLITEMPAGRKNIVTKIISPDKRSETYEFIRKEIRAGRQAFVICPRIEQAQAGNDSTTASVSETQKKLWEVKSVTEEYEKLSKTIFPDLRVAMLHGRLKPKEKEKIMREFGEGKTDILVSTSVVEVGVDIPNATIMMIEGSDRFGLAQLYQFRGRVGRGEHQSYCLLFTDSSSKTTAARLKAIAEAKNGFELAEQDLKLRGPGEFLGQSQSGFPDIAMESLNNPELVKSAREAAAQILKTDTNLKKYPLLKERLTAFQNEIHLE